MKGELNIKINYVKARLNLNFFIGIIWFLLGLGYLFSPNNSFVAYAYLILSLLYFLSFYYDKRYGYLTINNNILKKRDNPFFNYGIAIKDIKGIVKINEDYILKTDSNSIRIQSSVICENSKSKLDDFMNQLEASIKLTNEKNT